LVLTSGIVSASPFPQQPENQAKGEEIIFKRAPQNKQNEHQKQSQAQRSFQQAQLRSSLSSEGYDRPPADDEFEYSSDEYANPGFQSASSGFNRRLFRPSGNREFDSFDRREFDYGNRPAFGGWKKPTRPKPVWSTSDREFGISNGVGVPGANSLDEPTSNDRRQSGSNAVDDQQGSSIGGSGNDNRGSGTLGGSTSVNENRPQSVGGLPWTTVRSPVNRIFVDYTVPEAECIRKCPSLSQYDPICGTDNITYTNRAKFQCAQECGRALECAEHQEAVGVNDTKLERSEANATSSPDAGFKSDQPDFVKLLKKPCSCPCNSVPKIPVCGRTTNGLSRTFDSQCHLICYNQCDGSLERYAITFVGQCPAVPSLNRKNVFSNAYENRRIEYASPYHGVINPIHLYEDAPGFVSQAYAPSEIYEVHRPGYTGNSLHQGHDFVVSSSSESSDAAKPSTGLAFVTLLETSTKNASPDAAQSSQSTVDASCNCNYCQETRWIRLDYYPICAERNGQRRTFESWCHFDCENKCVKRTGDSFLYMHKGACVSEPEEEIVVPRTVNVASVEVCAACSSLCRTFFEPVCAKNGKNEYLSFKSRCHMRCHNRCHYQRANETIIAIVASSPLDKKDKNPAFGKCNNICDSVSNEPLCATDGNKLTLSFANECALKKYNCEHNKILTKKADKECPNSQGIRLR
ncbi:hypothetical protein V9T40_010689, partial [Parthenolecanium corni]